LTSQRNCCAGEYDGTERSAGGEYDGDHEGVYWSPIRIGFIGRARRVHLNIPVVFEHAGGTAAGKTVDISESGILVEFDEIMDLWTTGDLSLEGDEWQLQISARVARVNGRQAAFAFRGMDSSELELVRSLIAEIQIAIKHISR